MSDEELISRLEEHGPEHVKELLRLDGFPHWMRPAIARWLSKKDSERQKSPRSSSHIVASNTDDASGHGDKESSTESASPSGSPPF
jgi:hypothetical protein